MRAEDFMNSAVLIFISSSIDAKLGHFIGPIGPEAIHNLFHTLFSPSPTSSHRSK